MSYMPVDRKGHSYPVFTVGTVQTNITTSGTSQQSAAFGSSTTVVRIRCSAAAYVAFGADPTASSSTYWIAADTDYDLGVTPGHKVAVIQETSAGTFRVCECA